MINQMHFSQRFLLLLLVAGAWHVAANAETGPPEQSRWQRLANPSAPGSLAPRLVQAGDGTVYLSWLQKHTSGTSASADKTRHALKYARLQDTPNKLVFLPARSIASGSEWFANWADTPALHIHSDALWLAHWLQKSAASTYAYDIKLSFSHDQGDTWSEPFSPHIDDTPTEHGFVSYFPMAKDRSGMIWLDGRETQESQETHASHDHGGSMTLRTAGVDSAGNISQSALLDQRVCDCCQTAAVSTSEATVIAYRDRTKDEIRDIAIMRRNAQGWSEPAIVHHDGWRISACPVNGPALAARGRQLAVAWFTMAEDKPRIHLALSSDAGETFSAPQTFASGTALGRVQLLQHADGWLLSWMDQPATGAAAVIRLAGLNADGSVRWQQELRGVSAQRSSGIPRIAVLANGRIIMAWTAADNGQSVIATSVFDPGGE